MHAACAHSHSSAVRRDAQEARKRHLEEARALQARLEALDGDNRALREAKALLDSRASELACRLGVAEGNARALDDEASHLRGVASSAARDRADRDAEASDLRARLRLGDDKVHCNSSRGIMRAAKCGRREAASTEAATSSCCSPLWRSCDCCMPHRACGFSRLMQALLSLHLDSRFTTGMSDAALLIY